MTSILVKALEDLLEVKNHKDIAGKDAWYNSNQPKAWQQAREALSLYSQSMNTEDHARDYYMNDDGQSKPEPVVQDNEMWHPNYYPQSKEGEYLQQDLKELDAPFDYLYKMQYVKDAGHSWIEFTDKWNAFKKKLLSKENEGKQAGVMAKHIEMMKTALLIVTELGEEQAASAIQSCIDNAELLLQQPIESGERGEVERLKGLLKEQFCAVVLACMSGVGMEAKDELLESQWEIYKMENNV